MKDYSWIRDVEKYILAVWMKTGMTASMAKNKRSENINDWCIYEDYYDKQQICWITVASKRIARAMSFQLNKTIEKLGYKDYFWTDYIIANEDYENAPIVIIGVESNKLNSKNLSNLYTLIKLKDSIMIKED